MSRIMQWTLVGLLLSVVTVTTSAAQTGAAETRTEETSEIKTTLDDPAAVEIFLDSVIQPLMKNNSSPSGTMPSCATESYSLPKDTASLFVLVLLLLEHSGLPVLRLKNREISTGSQPPLINHNSIGCLRRSP